MLVIGLICILLAIPLFSYRISPIIFNRITSIILIYSALLSINVLDISSLASGLGIYSGLFHVSSTTLTIESFLFICGAIILIGYNTLLTINKNVEPSSTSTDSTSTLRASDDAIVISNNNNTSYYPVVQEYSILVVFTVIGQSLLISSSDIVSMYLSIELQSFAVYIICTLYRNSESATSAGLKYFLLGGLSSAVILLGTGVIYNYTGLTEFESIYLLCQVNDQSSMLTEVTLGLVLIGIGFLFKVASAPLHNWAPDVYDGVPTIVTIFISTIPKISLFVFILELQTFTSILGQDSFIINDISSNIDINIIKNLLLIGSVLSLIIGTVLGLSQYRIKRLLAYSTISHVGFLLLALLINSEESIESFLFYIIQYSVTNICAFLCLLQFSNIRQNRITLENSNITKLSKNSINKKHENIINNNSGDIEFIHELKGEFNQNPVLAFAFSMCIFSIAGIPPLIGFFAKQIVLYSSTHAGYYFISIIAVVVSVISASYYLKIVKVLYFNETTASESVPLFSIFTVNNEDNTQKKHKASFYNVETSEVHSLCISVLLVIITLFVLQPQILLNTINLLALTLFYY